MTEKMKLFLEKVSGNKELLEKARNADEATLTTMAKELGIELAHDDFVVGDGEIPEEEMDTAVIGGLDVGHCFCGFGGGGKGDDKRDPCACVLMGFGDRGLGQGIIDCACFIGGSGIEDED